MTLTAPGADRLPWDRARCHHHPDVECSGSIGCVCEAEPLARWHHDVAQRWSWFVTELRRSTGVDVQFFKTWETQSRGALHVHAMVRATGITERRFRAAVRLAAFRWGFGRQSKVDTVNLSNPLQIARTAGYCAKYCTKSADALPDVLRLSPDGELAIGGLRSWSASRRWGDTMRLVESRRAAWAAGAAVAGDGVAEPTTGGGEADSLDLYGDLYATDIPGLRFFRPSGTVSPM